MWSWPAYGNISLPLAYISQAFSVFNVSPLLLFVAAFLYSESFSGAVSPIYESFDFCSSTPQSWTFLKYITHISSPSSLPSVACCQYSSICMDDRVPKPPSFGFDISSRSAIIGTTQYIDYFDSPHGLVQGAIGLPSLLAQWSVLCSLVLSPIGLVAATPFSVPVSSGLPAHLFK